MRVSDSVLIYDGPRLEDARRVGHKFARQAVLRRHGYPVPPFVCVPVEVYDTVAAPVLPPAPAGTEAMLDWAAEARALVLGAALPDALHSAIRERFADLAGDNGMVAVRACVVAGPGGQDEDSAQDPQAGLSDSFLDVPVDEVADRIVECWASAFNPEAVLYRIARAQDPRSARVAVGIQRMMSGGRSFVAFTRDPRDGARRCVIAAAYGNGEGIVQEKADVDHFMIDRDSGAIDRRLARKSRAVSGSAVEPVPAELADLPVLADPELRRIVALTDGVAELFGAPQDIEGTVDDDGSVHLVQARPVAVPPTSGEWIPWGNDNVTESFPGVSGALTFSLALRLYEAGFTDTYRRLGIPARVLHREAHRLRRMIGYLDGRIYYRLDSWYHLHGLIRCFRPLWPTWGRMVGVAAAPTERQGRLRTAVHLAELAARGMTHPLQVRRFLAWWDAYHERFRDLSRLRADELVELHHGLWAQVAIRWGTTLTNGLYLMAVTWVANGLLRRWAPDADSGLIPGMLCGGEENRSAEALRSAIRLAEIVRSSPSLRAAIDGDARTAWSTLMAADERFAEELLLHIRNYGDRALQDLKLESSTPRQEPWALLDVLLPYVDSDLTVQANRDAEAEVRRSAEKELRARCRNPLKRAVLRTLFRMMRRLVRVREDSRFCRSQLIGDARELLLRLGAELASAGRLDGARDVLDLTVDEVLGAFEGTLPGADLRSLAALRAQERERRLTGPEPPPRLETAPGLPVADALALARTPETLTAAKRLSGLGSCPGVVRGKARVVLDPRIAVEDCRDTILVARETDPGWLFLMLVAKGLVVERGTLLSHTAITGRLLGVPTVVAVDGATSLIQDGSLIEVDGRTGEVRIISEEVAS